MKQIPLLTDQALGEGNDIDFDGLGFSVYAKVLADATVNTAGPFSIGVFGEWGTGKTSLMRIVEAELKKRNNAERKKHTHETKKEIITIWFNAWRYEKEEHPIIPLIGTIVKEVEKNEHFLENLQNEKTSFLKLLRAVAYGVSLKSKLMIPGFAEVEASFVAKDMLERKNKLTPDPLLDRSLYYEAYENLSAHKVPKNSRIVIIIDDLDRCFPDYAVKLLESIKLVLAQPGFIFIIGIARKVIEGYLQHRYEKDFGVIGFKGNSYLDKIIQLPFHIPSHSDRMEEFSNKILRRIDDDIKNELYLILPIIGAVSGGNPRAMIRFINNLIIDIAINDNLKKDNVTVEIGYFAISRCLQQRWSEIYYSLIQSGDLCVKIKEILMSGNMLSSDSASEEENGLLKYIQSDRDLSKLLKTKQGINWLSNEDERNKAVYFLQTKRKEFVEDVNKLYDISILYFYDDQEEVSNIGEALDKKRIRSNMIAYENIKNDIEGSMTMTISQARSIGICLGLIDRDKMLILENIMNVLALYESNKHVKVILIILSKMEMEDIPKIFMKLTSINLKEDIDDEKKILPLVNILIALREKENVDMN
jgi:hypothetical protein